MAAAAFVIIALAVKLFVACGAYKLIKVDIAVKADCLSARGANYLKAIIVVTVITVALVAVAFVFIIIQKLLDLAEILVDLLDIIVKCVAVLLKPGD